MTLDVGWAQAIVPLVLGIGSAVAWYFSRRDKNKDPIPKREAELAIARQALGIIEAAAAFSAKEAGELRVRVDQLERDRSTDRVRITRLESLLGHAAAYIEALLRWAQVIPTDPARPVPPLPKELHELVDPQLWVTTTPPENA